MNRQTRRQLCWTLVAVLVATTASAQGPLPRPKLGTWNPQAASPVGYYGVLGEVARPGVYSAEGREITLQELIHHAGGMTPFAGPAVRLIRQQRIAQGRLFDPTGRDVLQPGDVIMVESRQPRTIGSTPAVHVAMIGVADRPVIVPLRPEDAQPRIIIEALTQSPELMRKVQYIPPSRHPLPTSPSSPLANGTILIFDPSLLVSSRLPEFPEAIPLAAPAPQVPNPQPTNDASLALPPSTAIPAPSAADRIADNRLPVTNAGRFGGAVEATPLPFNNLAQPPRVSDTSLPVPGSRLQPSPVEPPTSNATRPKHPVPTLNDDSEIIPDLEDLDIDDEAVAPIAAETPAGFSVWQMLGIVGTVASLVGLAVLSRNFVGPKPTSTENRVPEAIRRRTEMTGGEPRRPIRRFDLPEPTPAPATAATMARAIPSQTNSAYASIAPDREPHDLAEMLAMRGPIETEGVVLPHGLKLRRSPFAPIPSYRVDEAATLPAAPHERPVKPTTPQRTLDPIAEETIPAPHFAVGSHSPEAPLDQPLVEALPGGTAIERALHQLQRGKSS